jgi:hypothetical protein
MLPFDMLIMFSARVVQRRVVSQLAASAVNAVNLFCIADWRDHGAVTAVKDQRQLLGLLGSGRGIIFLLVLQDPF